MVFKPQWEKNGFFLSGPYQLSLPSELKIYSLSTMTGKHTFNNKKKFPSLSSMPKEGPEC